MPKLHSCNYVILVTTSSSTPF